MSDGMDGRAQRSRRSRARWPAGGRRGWRGCDWSALAVGAAVLVLGSRPAAAQRDHDAAIARARVHVARLRTLFRAESAATARDDSLRAYVLPPDSLTAGGLRIRFDPAYEGRVRPAAARAAAALDSVFGDASTTLRGDVMVVRRGFTTMRSPVLGVFGAVGTQDYVPAQIAEVVGGKVTERYRDRVPADGAVALADRFQRLGVTWFFNNADVALREWMRTPLNVFTPLHREAASVYVDLLTSQSQVGRQCFAGDLTRCRDALLLNDVDDPARAWYAPADRRTAVRALAGHLRAGRNVPVYDACELERSDAACLRLLEGVPADEMPPPLEFGARHALIRVALTSGGAGAYARLVADRRAPLGARLASAAGVSLDSLTSLWLATVRAARPQTLPLAPTTAWAALAWSLLFGVAALRSSRWR